jgi:uncharacterized protein YuzE
MEITVAVPAAYIELSSASRNLGSFRTYEMSEPDIFINIDPKGQITATKRRIPSSILTELD